MARVLTQAIMLLIALTVLPAPTGPTLKVFRPRPPEHGPGPLRASRTPTPQARGRGRAAAAHTAADRRFEEAHASRRGARLDLAGRGGQDAAEIDEDRPGR